MRKILAVMALLGLVAVAGCNTAEGFGQDVQNTGDAIEDEAQE